MLKNLDLVVCISVFFWFFDLDSGVKEKYLWSASLKFFDLLIRISKLELSYTQRHLMLWIWSRIIFLIFWFWISISWTKYFYDVLLLISKMLSSIFSDYQLGLTTVHLSSKHPKFLGGQSWFRQIFWQSNKLKKTNFQQRGGGYINSERCFTIHIWWFGDSLFPRVIRCELVPCVFVSLFIWKPYQKLRIC